jgi:hypothetical protein
VCSSCDRGQRYCGPACSQEARQERQREAGARYQRTPRGRRHHAARQALCRRRQQQAEEKKVTHQGSLSPAVLGRVEVTVALSPRSSGIITEHEKDGLRWTVCHFCGARCAPFARREPLGWRRRRRGAAAGGPGPRLRPSHYRREETSR